MPVPGGSVWYLEGILDSDKRWITNVTVSPFVIGRADDCNLTLKSKTVSRKHAKILNDFNVCYIKDCKSTNGTVVNGRKIGFDPIRLKEMDIICIGEFEFRFKIRMNDLSSEDMNTLLSGKTHEMEDFSVRFGLTERETEILFLLLKGYSTKKIGEMVFISPGTAKNHILKIFKKVNVHSRFELLTQYNAFSEKK